VNARYRMAIVVLAIGIALPSTSSTALAQGEGWGLTLGATSTQLYGDFVTSRGDARWGFTGGAYGERQLGGGLGVYLGVEYAQRGGQGLTGPVTDLESFDIDLDYVSIPLLVEVLLPLGEVWGLVAYGGMAADVSVKCRAKLGDAEKQPCKETALGGAKTTWSAPAGGGLSYRVGDSDAVVFEARYSWGLSDAVSDQEVRNRGWNFQLRLARTM